MPTTTPDPRPSRAEAALLAGVLVAGTFARVAWIADKPFWRDEAWVAAAAREPLADALARSAPVPIGFLALTRLAHTLPLAPEVALRLLPLATGIAAVLAIPALAAALGASRRVALASAWMAAGLPPFIYYSRELKPYAIDLLLGALVPWLAVRVFAPPPAWPRPRAWMLMVLLAVTPWISFGGV